MTKQANAPDNGHIVEMLHRISEDAASRALGISARTIRRWVKGTSDTPLWTVPAVKGLIGEAENEPVDVLVVISPRSKTNMAAKLLGTLDLVGNIVSRTDEADFAEVAESSG